MQEPVKIILRSAWRVLLVLMLSGLLAACAGQTTAADSTPLRVEWTIWHGDYTLLIAQEKGFFEKHGVKVEPVFYQNFALALPDLAGGRIDIGLFGMVDALNVANLADVKAAAVYDSGGETSLVTTPDIRTLADLKGKRIGVAFGSSAEMVIRDVLRQAGLTLHDVTLVNVPVLEIPARLQQDIQAGVTYQPYTSQAVNNGSHTLAVSGISSLLPDVIVVRGDLAAQRPEALRAFLAAWFEAVQYRLEYPLESNQIIARYSGVPATELLAGDAELFTLEDNRRLYVDESGGELPSIYQIARINMDFMVGSGSLTNLLDLRHIFDPAYLPSDQTAELGR